ncbi:hypothetical protein FS749_015029 [Ceratobasidium sp. UAMH 11750]|nr:hypothetical protein FS749_015029 [Ceratobasidium sp. UAMH 11750]
MSSDKFSTLLSLPVKAGTRTTKSRLSTRAVGLGKLPMLITRTSTLASLDAPRVTNITVSAHKLSISTLPVSKAQEEPEAGVYKTLDSTTRFAIIVPLSVSRAHVLPFQPSNEQIPIPVVPTPTRPKHSITVQRLGTQTPSPPWAVRHMLTRGGGRFSLMSLPDFHRPASERLAVQYAVGRSEVVAAGKPSMLDLSPPSNLLHLSRARNLCAMVGKRSIPTSFPNNWRLSNIWSRSGSARVISSQWSL